MIPSALHSLAPRVRIVLTSPGEIHECNLDHLGYTDGPDTITERKLQDSGELPVPFVGCCIVKAHFE